MYIIYPRNTSVLIKETRMFPYLFRSFMTSPDDAKRKLHIAARTHSFELMAELRVLGRERARIEKLVAQHGVSCVSQLLKQELVSIRRQEAALTATSLQVTRVNRSAETMLASTAAIEAVESINEVCMDVRPPNRDPSKTSGKWQRQAYVKKYIFICFLIHPLRPRHKVSRSSIQCA